MSCDFVIPADCLTFDSVLQDLSTHVSSNLGTVGHTGTGVDLNQPGLVILRQHEVSTVQLKRILEER